MDGDEEKLDPCPDVTNNHTILDAYDVDQTELNALKGDTIGNTVYSAKWVLTTLMSLSKIYDTGWTNALESDLCTLWDMTTEKDIVMYLLENKFLNIAATTLQNTDETRLMEILVGIIGNMCYHAAVLRNVGDTEELVEVILLLLHSDDTETLIQVFRVLQAAVCDVQRNDQSIWLEKLQEREFLGDAVLFVLNSSTNDDLLSAAIGFVYIASEVKLSDNNNFFKELFNVNKLLAALSEAFVQLFPVGASHVHGTGSKVVENWLSILSNLIKQEMIELNEENTREYIPKLTSILSSILQPYKNTWNLVPLDECTISCIHYSLEVVLWFQYHQLPVSTEISSVFATIISKLKYENRNQPANDFHVTELLKYLEIYWLEILNTCQVKEICKILCSMGHQVVRNLIDCVQSHPRSSNSQTEKLMQAASHLEII